MDKKKKFCTACGKENDGDAEFCTGCGKKFGTVKKGAKAKSSGKKNGLPKTCPFCTAPLAPGAEVCEYCGSTVAAPAVKGARAEKSAEEKPERKTKKPSGEKAAGESVPANRENKPKKKRGFIKFLAILLVAAILFVSFVNPGYVRLWLEDDVRKKPSELPYMSEAEAESIVDPDPSGLSDIRFDQSAYDAKPETADVNLDCPAAYFDSGVAVVFGDYCLNEYDQELEVLSLGETGDGVYGAVGYDFLLDGKEAGFDGLAEITVPYDPAWGTNVFVQYLDEKTGNWEIIYAEPDGAGSITFRTDHFCTFAVFCDMVNKGTSGDSSGDIITFTDEYSDGMHVRAVMHWDNLAAKIRAGKMSDEEKIRNITSKGGSDFIGGALSFSADSSDGISALAEIAENDTVSEIMGPLGVTLDVAQVFYRGYKQGFMNALADTDYWQYVGMKAIEAGSKLPGKVGLACKVLRVMISAGKVSGSAIDAVLLDGAADRTDYAYRLFSERYLVYDSARGYVDYSYYSGPQGEAETILGANRYPLKCQRADSDWTQVFNDAYAREKKGQMDAFEYVERIVDSFAKAFWRVDRDDLEDFLRNNYAGGYVWDGALINSYKTPDRKTRDAYIEQYKSDIYRWLGGFMETLLEKKYNDVLCEVYAKYSKLVTEMNTEYTVVLKDPNKEYFSESEFASRVIGLAPSETDKIAINLSRYEIGGRLTMTGASYMLAGSPEILRVLGTKDDISDASQNYLTKKIKLKAPETVIVLDWKEETPEDGGVIDIDEDGIDWNQSDAWDDPGTEIPEISDEDMINYSFLGYWKCPDGKGSYSLVVLELNRNGSLLWWNFTSHDSKEHAASVSVYPDFEWDAKKGVLHVPATVQRAGTLAQYKTEDVVITMNGEDKINGVSYQNFTMERIPMREVYSFDVDRYPGMTPPSEDSVSYDLSSAVKPSAPVGGGFSVAGRVDIGGN